MTKGGQTSSRSRRCSSGMVTLAHHVGRRESSGKTQINEAKVGTPQPCPARRSRCRDRFLVPNGSTIVGTRADAVIAVLESEHARRVAAGLGAVTDVWIIDALMNLPIGAPVPIDSLSAEGLSDLRRAPASVVDFSLSSVTRRTDTESNSHRR